MTRFATSFSTAVLLAASLGLGGCSTSRSFDTEGAMGSHPLLEEVARFDDASPAGVAVSSEGRQFLAFPHLEGRSKMSVAELKGGVLRPFPQGAWNVWDGQPGPTALRTLVNAQALTVTRDDEGESLWILDSGEHGEQGVVAGGPKLIQVNLNDDRVMRIFYLDHARELSQDTRLTDLRVDMGRKVAYVADCGHGAIVVVDLESGVARSVLAGQDVTGAEIGVDLRHTLRPDLSAQSKGAALGNGVAAIELSIDGETLYFHAREGRTLYSVSTAVLRNSKNTDFDIVAQVENLGRTGSAVDGIVLDPQSGDLYLTAVERRGLRVRRANGVIEEVLGDDRLRWPDGLAMAPNGDVYVADSARQYRAPFANNSRTSEPGGLMKFNPSQVDYAKQMAVSARCSEQALAAAERRAAEQALAAAERQAAEQALAVASIDSPSLEPWPELDRIASPEVDDVASVEGVQEDAVENALVSARFSAYAAEARGVQAKKQLAQAQVLSDEALSTLKGEKVLLSWQQDQLKEIETHAAATTTDEELNALTPQLKRVQDRVAASTLRVSAARAEVVAQDVFVAQRETELDVCRVDHDRAMAALDEVTRNITPAMLADVPTD